MLLCISIKIVKVTLCSNLLWFQGGQEYHICLKILPSSTQIYHISLTFSHFLRPSIRSPQLYYPLWYTFLDLILSPGKGIFKKLVLRIQRGKIILWFGQIHISSNVLSMLFLVVIILHIKWGLYRLPVFYQISIFLHFLCNVTLFPTSSFDPFFQQ